MLMLRYPRSAEPSPSAQAFIELQSALRDVFVAIVKSYKSDVDRIVEWLAKRLAR